VVLTETLPAYTSYAGGGWTQVDDSSTYTMSIGEVQTGTTGTVDFIAVVTSTLPPGVTEVTNTIAIGPVDDTPENNTHTITTPVLRLPDLQVSKDDGGVSVSAGHRISYIITYSNTGDLPAEGVVLTETLPANTSYAGGGWTQVNGGTYTKAIGTLTPTTGTARFIVQVDFPLSPGVTEVTNTVTIGPDDTPENNTYTITTPVSAAPPRPWHPTKVRFEGPIQTISDTIWVVRGITVTIDANTKIFVPKGKQAEVGDWAKVQATRQRDGSLLATYIRVQKHKDRGAEPVQFKGVIESIECVYSGCDWVVSGITVTLDARTVVKGAPCIECIAEVNGFLQDDDTVLARRIKVESPEEGAAWVEFEGIIESIGDNADVSTLSSVWIVGGTTVVVDANTVITGTPQVGAVAEVRGLEQADGSVRATEIAVEAAEGEEVEFEGIIEELPDHPRLHGDWVIGGTTVAVDGRTLIDESRAAAEEGNYAEVRAIRQANGCLLAIRIKVERHG